MSTIENHPFAELKTGDSASLVRTLSERDIELFAVMSGDVNPAHLDPVYAQSDMFHRVVAHGMWGGALISAVLGTQLPGPGTIYLEQSLRFLQPICLGDTVTVTVTVAGLDPAHHRATLACRVTNQRNDDVIVGTALVIAPTAKLALPRIELPEIDLVPPRQAAPLAQGIAGNGKPD